MTPGRAGTPGPAARARPSVPPCVRGGAGRPRVRPLPWRRATRLAAALLLLPVSASAQAGADSPERWAWPEAVRVDASRLAGATDAFPPTGEPAGGAPASRPAWQYGLASAAVPGIGQLARGQERGFVYLLAEGLIWLGFVRERNLGLDARASYRRLGWEVARAGAGEPGDGDFEYYERMARWTRSGAFDTDPGAQGVQPETDPATFNGDAWRLASELYLGAGPADPSNPGWDQAISFYSERAYAEPLTWSWAGAEAQYRRFGLLISESDTRLGRASLFLGGAVLNRVLSGLDAVLSRTTGRDASLRFHISPVAAPLRGAVQPVLQLRIATP